MSALEEVVLADPNAIVPQDSDYAVRAWVDNNSVLGVAVDLNQSRPTAPPEKPDEPEITPAPDPESDWLGDRRDSSGTNLPQSVYTEPDLTFVDPDDHEEPFGESDLGAQLAAQANVPA